MDEWREGGRERERGREWGELQWQIGRGIEREVEVQRLGEGRGGRRVRGREDGEAEREETLLAHHAVSNLRGSRGSISAGVVPLHLHLLVLLIFTHGGECQLDPLQSLTRCKAETPYWKHLLRV